MAYRRYKITVNLPGCPTVLYDIKAILTPHDGYYCFNKEDGKSLRVPTAFTIIEEQ